MLTRRDKVPSQVPPHAGQNQALSKVQAAYQNAPTAIPGPVETNRPLSGPIFGHIWLKSRQVDGLSKAKTDPQGWATVDRKDAGNHSKKSADRNKKSALKLFSLTNRSIID